jgi:hypothetical protein
MAKLIRRPIRPYWLVFSIVLAGILMETAAAIVEARPLRAILDNVVSNHHLPNWLTDSVGPLPGGASKLRVAAFFILWLLTIAAAKAISHWLSTGRRTGRVVEIKSGRVGKAGDYAQRNEVQYETKAALAA